MPSQSSNKRKIRPNERKTEEEVEVEEKKNRIIGE